MGWFLGISGVIQVALAVFAVLVGAKALRVSERVERDSVRERDRADDRQRLMWLQTLLNELVPLQEEELRPHERGYLDRQRWIRTCLAVGGLRYRLPETAALSDRPFVGGSQDVVDAVDRAWQEIHHVLEVEADRAYAGERLA